MPDLTNNFLQLIAAFLVAVLASFAAIPLCKKFDLIDHPGAAPHKQHARPTPLAGGLVIGLSLLLLIPFFPGLIAGKMLGVILATIVVLAFGLWDDISGLSAGIKFTGQLIAACIAVYSGIHIGFLSNLGLPFGELLSKILDIILTVFWLVGITNAFNLIDSMDGIVAGLSTLSSAFFIFVTFTSDQPSLTAWSAILAGISLALYFWNSPPARYFLGDSGAQPLGFLLAVLALLYNPVHKDPASSWFVPILILGVPIFDTSLVVFSRLRRHRPPFEGSRDHTYHRLQRAGLNSSRAVSLIHIVALTLDTLALFALSQKPLFANAILAGCLLAGAILIVVLDSSRKFINPLD